MTVSVALIVKNEEHTLGRCLDSLAGAVDELVVVDTGSTDATKQIAHRHGANVLDFAWRRDFAAARQFAFDHATGDWVFWLDADDVVLGADRIRPLTANAPADVGGFYWRYVLTRDAAGAPTFEFWRERCVRNDGAFRWVGRVHEVLVAHEPRTLVRAADVVVEHHPEPDRSADNPRRNLEIMEEEYAAAAGALEPRRLFYLGREYADVGEADRAIEILERYVAVGTWDDERYLAQIRLADLHRARADHQRALDADLQALKIHPRWPDAYFGLAETYYYLRDWPKVLHWADLGRALPPPDTLLFVNPRDYDLNWIIFYTNALYHTGAIDEAVRWTRHALEINPDDHWHQHNLTFFTAPPTTEPSVSPPPDVTPFPEPEQHFPLRRLRQSP